MCRNYINFLLQFLNVFRLYFDTKHDRIQLKYLRNLHFLNSNFYTEAKRHKNTPHNSAIGTNVYTNGVTGTNVSTNGTNGYQWCRW